MARRWRDIAGWCGIGAVAILLVAMVSLTLYERAYLQRVGWSPVQRTPTEWPSVLATGPGGWLMCLTFAVAGGLVLVLGVGLWRLSAGRTRAVGLCVAVASLGLMGVAFPADPPTAAAESWHAAVHNTAYPILLVAVLASMGTASSGALSPPLENGTTRARLLLGVAVPLILLTYVDAIAQLARYGAFAAMFGWLLSVCWPMTGLSKET